METANNIQGSAARYWHRLDDGRLQCDLCPRYCKLHAGQRGLCFVRANGDDRMLLTTYGRSSGFCIDPIEKKPLNHFLPGTSVLSFGTAGCNLACKFCQNRNVAVPAGYITDDAREEFFRRMDAVNVDLKAFTERFYWKICGGHLEPVLDTLRYLKSETDAWLELTTLLIPGENDSDNEIDAMTRWIAGNLGQDVPLHFTAFHPSWKMMDTPSTPKSTLTRCREIALRNGLRYVFTGNVRDPAGASTYCPGCGAIVIARDGYELGDWNLDVRDGKAACRTCGEPIAGVFEARPGHWGARRQPLHFAMR